MTAQKTWNLSPEKKLENYNRSVGSVEDLRHGDVKEIGGLCLVKGGDCFQVIMTHRYL